jgi:hypothetical protein
VLALAAAMGAFCAPPPDDSSDPLEKDPADLNVNARYTVERVDVAMVSPGKRPAPQLSNSLRSEVDQVMGQKYDRSALQDLAGRIKKELHVADVKVNVTKGNAPESVIVTFEIKSEKNKALDLSMSKLLYHSRQGFTVDTTAAVRINGNSFIFGYANDNDVLVERFEGIRAGYERKSVGTSRLRLRFMFSNFHQRWNDATLAAAPASELYRSRQNFTPEATVVIAEPLELSFGVDFARYLPDVAGAKTESSNAVVSTLRYHRRWGSDQDPQDQDLRASYGIRAATGFLESDRIFTRHTVDARYRFRRGRNAVELSFLGGRISGNAPLFERFTLGNARTLRGWNRFDIAPLGGSHVAHGSIEYSYRGFMVFYDTGAIWDYGYQREQRNSLGVGFKTKEKFQLAVAFPVREGRVDPVFYTGVAF